MSCLPACIMMPPVLSAPDLPTPPYHHTHPLTLRHEVWPEESGLSAVSDGTFVVGHARAVQVLCRLAPARVAAALATVLADMVTPEKLQVWTNGEPVQPHSQCY